MGVAGKWTRICGGMGVALWLGNDGRGSGGGRDLVRLGDIQNGISNLGKMKVKWGMGKKEWGM